jgi:hypothetical protein
MAWLLIAVALLSAAWLSLWAVQSGFLFAYPLPVDPQPFDHEYSDAIRAAREWTVPALAFLSVASIAVLVGVRQGPIDAAHYVRMRQRQLFDSHSALCHFFILACIADFASTARYFHEIGISDEFHPAIKLIAYAWGRSIGCLIAKSIQGILVLLVCAVFPKIARTTLLVTIAAYTAAAVCNFWAL